MLAEQACRSCKLRKRKCTKELPDCSLCSRRGRKCDYSLPKRICKTEQRSSLSYSVNRRRVIRQPLDVHRLMFLDSRIADIGTVRPPGNTPTHILELLGATADMWLLASEFFDTVSYWTPIISKQRFYDHHLQSFPPSPELAMLLLTMKVITTSLDDDIQSPLTSDYFAAKHFFIELEASGTYSIQVLQALILLALYEIGHAVYPAAFSTISICAKYAEVLGIDGRGKSHVNGLHTFVEQEEARRIWWAIVIMDRLVSIGCRHRRFVAQEPGPDHLLPSNEEAWDNGDINPTHLSTISQPSRHNMSKFALVAQCARLLGLVLEHVSSDRTDLIRYEARSKQLSHTIYSLIAVAEATELPSCDPLAICLGSLIILHENELCSYNTSSSSIERSSASYPVLETKPAEVAASVASILRDKLPDIVCNLKCVSPWGIYTGYQAGIVHLRMIREANSREHSKGLSILRDSLRAYDTRWRLAGAFIQVLEAREVMGLTGETVKT